MQAPEATAFQGPVTRVPNGGIPDGKAFTGPVPEQFALEKCPDFVNRMTLTDGKTIGVPYPKEGYNCNEKWFHWNEKDSLYC